MPFVAPGSPAEVLAVPAPALQMPAGAVVVVNLLLAVVMFGIAVDLDLAEVRRTLRSPWPLVVGVVAQFGVLPGTAVGLIAVLDPPPQVALGLLLVATVPGGAISNAIVHLGDGNTSLSIAMTGTSTLVALVLTPLNLATWGAVSPQVGPVLRDIALDPVELAVGLLVVIGLPVAAGVLLQIRLPELAARLVRPLRLLAVVLLLSLTVGVLALNLGGLVVALRVVAPAVVVQNLVALAVGYGLAIVARLVRADRRAVAIEVAVQNSALALTIGLTMFPSLPGVAVTAALYGVWHVLAGLTLARWWSGRPLWQPAARDRSGT